MAKHFTTRNDLYMFLDSQAHDDIERYTEKEGD